MQQRHIALLSTLVLAAALGAGCATTGMHRSPKEAVQARIEAWRTDMLALDYDRIMAHYSEDFKNAEGLDKQAYRGYLVSLKDYMSAMQIDLSTARIAINGNIASVNPIEITIEPDGYDMEMTLRGESGGWLIYRSKVPY